MLAALWIATGCVIALGTIRAYGNSRDALHPAVLMSLPFGYFFCFWPLMLNREGGLHQYFGAETIEYAAWVFLASIAALYAGLNHRSKMPRSARTRQLLANIAARLSQGSRRRIYALAIVLGAAAMTAYASTFRFSLDVFIDAYSGPKGGMSAESGYVGEAINLSLPAILLIAVVARARGRLLVQDIALAILIAMPQLLIGTLGGRRGPIFIILATLFFARYIATGKTPRAGTIVAGIAAIGFTMIAIQENRRDVYLGSGESFEIARALDEIIPPEVEVGNEYLNAVVAVETSRFHGDYYWGYRYFVTFLIRPIPSEIWPDKYEAMNATWLDDFGTRNSNNRIAEATGFTVPAGVSTGSISDGYMEFSWGVVIMFYLLGRSYALVWRNHRLKGGYWTILYFLMLGLSVYLPSQSFSAWLIRLMFGAGFSFLLLRLAGGKEFINRREPNPKSMRAHAHVRSQSH